MVWYCVVIGFVFVVAIVAFIKNVHRSVHRAGSGECTYRGGMASIVLTLHQNIDLVVPRPLECEMRGCCKELGVYRSVNHQKCLQICEHGGSWANVYIGVKWHA